MNIRNENRQGYKNAKVGWIPEEWECAKLIEIAKINPESITDKTNKDYAFYYIDLSAVDKGKIEFPLNKIVLSKAPSRARRIVRNDDVLLATVRPNLKGFAYISFEINDIICSTGYAVIRSKKNVVSLYIYHNLFSYETECYFYSCVVGSNYPALNNSDIENLRIPLPPLPEQKKIAEILSAWDRAIEQVGKLIEAKGRLFKGLVQTLINNQCDNWNHLRGKDIFGIISEKNHRDGELLSVTQDRGVIPRTMLEGKVMSPEGSTAMYKLIKEGDFVISLRSFQGGIEYSRYQGIISPAYTILRPKIELYDDFYRHFFKTYLFIEKYLYVAVIGIRDGKQISIPDFMTVKIPYPPLDQQEQIGSILNTALQEINLLKSLQATCCKQKRGLMQKLLTGEVRVNTD